MRYLIDITEGLKIAFRALRMNKLRAALTTLGILIGVTTVVLIVTIILGLNKAVSDQFAFLGSNTLYVSKWDWMGDNWREMIKRPEMTPELSERIKKESELTLAVTPMAQKRRTVSFKSGRLTQVDIYGVTEEWMVTNSLRIDQGRFFNKGDVHHKRHVAVIGATIAETLFDKVGPLDQKIDIVGHKFQVIGVCEKSGKFFGQDMDNFVAIPFDTHHKRLGKDRYMDIVVKAVSADKMEDLEWELRGILRRARHLAPTEPDDFGINGQSLIMQAYHQATRGIYTGGFIIAFISLLVGGIGIMNIMLVSVTERTSEIGLRKALGAKRWQIAWQFMIESAVICALGGVVGVVLAYFGARAMNSFIPTAMPFWVAIFGVAFAAGVGTFFGLFPAVKAARLLPIEALRQE